MTPLDCMSRFIVLTRNFEGKVGGTGGDPKVSWASPPEHVQKGGLLQLKYLY